MFVFEINVPSAEQVHTFEKLTNEILSTLMFVIKLSALCTIPAY